VGALRDALTVLATLGPAGRKRLDLALSALDDLDPKAWTSVRAADAVYRITGDPGAAIPVLRNAWTRNMHTRRHIAAMCADLGAEGRPLHDLVEAELATVHRYNARLGTWSDSSVREDEEVLRLCRTALGAVPTGQAA
jgi:hypothetical protein